MKRHLLFGVVLVLLLVGCSSSKRPVLYPDQYFNTVGQHQVNIDIDACMRAAEATQIYMRFVDQCLWDKGYQPLG